MKVDKNAVQISSEGKKKTIQKQRNQNSVALTFASYINLNNLIINEYKKIIAITN